MSCDILLTVAFSLTSARKENMFEKTVAFDGFSIIEAVKKEFHLWKPQPFEKGWQKL